MEYMKQIIDYGVIGILLLMSVVSIGLAIERWLTYRALQLDDYTDKRELEIYLTSKLHLIATIASNAPYIGLLGTVLGIMATFYSMGLDGFMDTNKIMVGLALALKATAIGLLVAIPSVAFYNMLLRRVKVLLTQWDIRHDASPHA